MKIIYYSPHPTHDTLSEVGYSTHQRETIAAFRSLGHEVHEVVMGNMNPANHIGNKESHKEQKENRLKNLIKNILPTAIWNGLKDIAILQHDKKSGKQLERVIQEVKPDLIYERSEYLQTSGVQMAIKYQIKHYLEVNAPLVDEMRRFEGKSILGFLGDRNELKKFDGTQKIFVVSTSLRDYLRRKYSIKGEMKIIPNCINHEKVLPDEKQVLAVKNQINSKNYFLVGFVGSLFPYHGVDLLIKGFSVAVQRHPEMKLAIVGDGQIKPQLIQIAHQYLKSHQYIFTGNIPHHEVFSYIGSFDVAVMAASNWYGSPIKIFEYGFLGKPIIAPKEVPVEDVMENNIDGLLIRPGEFEIANAICYAYEHRKEMQAMGIHFKEKILEKYTWVKQAQEVLNE